MPMDKSEEDFEVDFNPDFTTLTQIYDHDITEVQENISVVLKN